MLSSKRSERSRARSLGFQATVNLDRPRSSSASLACKAPSARRTAASSAAAACSASASSRCRLSSCSAQLPPARARSTLRRRPSRSISRAALPFKVDVAVLGLDPQLLLGVLALLGPAQLLLARRPRSAARGSRRLLGLDELGRSARSRPRPRAGAAGGSTRGPRASAPSPRRPPRAGSAPASPDSTARRARRSASRSPSLPRPRPSGPSPRTAHPSRRAARRLTSLCHHDDRKLRRPPDGPGGTCDGAVGRRRGRRKLSFRGAARAAPRPRAPRRLPGRRGPACASTAACGADTTWRPATAGSQTILSLFRFTGAS